MHILPENLRPIPKRTIPYASVSVLNFQTNCTTTPHKAGFAGTPIVRASYPSRKKLV